MHDECVINYITTQQFIKEETKDKQIFNIYQIGHMLVSALEFTTYLYKYIMSKVNMNVCFLTKGKTKNLTRKNA